MKLLPILLPLLVSCNLSPEHTPGDKTAAYIDSMMLAHSDSTLVLHADSIPVITDTVPANVTVLDTSDIIHADKTTPDQLIAYAKTLKGIPYKYASTNPKVGFDCSGFITYVFNHFGVDVPRASVGFTNEGTPVSLAAAKPGDLILFTGTDSTIRTVGHMGIIINTGDSIVFIHSTSGKADGVTETTLNSYYMGRFVKVIRVFK
jgi:cell wall-associated NlpC family hydrolase